MSPTYQDFLKHQAEITNHLLFYLQAPFAKSSYIRGVLPSPAPLQALRVVIGPPIGKTSKKVIGHEIPLLHPTHNNFLTPQDVINVLRTLHSTPQFVSNDQVHTIMGIRFIQTDLSTLTPTPPTQTDKTLTTLHSLTTQTPHPTFRLQGFLALTKNRLRLYFSTPNSPTITTTEIHPSSTPQPPSLPKT
ncbi:hypothetical protein LO762_06620 [Actinocorallia sp. API 0066]|uniref:hypothetical protein n=1 Tax=Actinocorallia sp. API 0066 TaxID=2896846 RepID=UPI001E5C1251|nr:hypothetical protein [Actinocorallia sp. API 0066]MCD0448862.1 hypothetical protein [Actinocorallia sp. API 0066]